MKNKVMWFIVILVAIWIVTFPKINSNFAEPTKYHQGYEEVEEV